MPRASRTIPRRGSADLLSVGPDDVPRRAEVVDSLSAGISGIVIGDDVVERVAPVSDLDGAVRALGGAEQRGIDTGARHRGAVGQERGPVRSARVVAGRGRAPVRLKEIERSAGSVQLDEAQLLVA